MHTRFSTRGHQRVAYDLSGPAGAPAVVLLHDLLGQRSALAPLRDRLGDDLRSVAIDLRGHGASATISGASIDLGELALDVAAVLAQEGIDTAVFVGHGLGAAVSHRLAADLPALAIAVVAIDRTDVGLDGEPLAAADQRAADLAYKGLADAALAAYLTPRLGPTWRDDLHRPTVAALRRHAPALAALLPALAASAASPSGNLDAIIPSADAVIPAAGAVIPAAAAVIPSTDVAPAGPTPTGNLGAAIPTADDVAPAGPTPFGNLDAAIPTADVVGPAGPAGPAPSVAAATSDGDDDAVPVMVIESTPGRLDLPPATIESIAAAVRAAIIRRPGPPSP